MKKLSDKVWGIGVILLIFGGAGLAEVITSGRGSFLVSTIVLSVGIALILESYVL